jgi:hypothetical protein
VERKPSELRLKKRGIRGALPQGNALLLRRIGKGSWSGHKTTLAGQMSSRMRSSRVMKHGHNLGNILNLESLASLRRRSIRIVWHQDIRGRLDGYFGGL